MTELKDELLKMLMVGGQSIQIETKYTLHYLERLMPSASDRGTYKWFAESKKNLNVALIDDHEWRRSFIDYCDLFPRLYFYPETFFKEFCRWLELRNLELTAVHRL